MPRRKQYNIVSGLAGALCLLIAPCAVRAQVSTPTVTLVNGLFHYDYSISNTASDDLFDATVHVLPGVGVVTNFAAPTGFNAIYDSGLGLVDFAEDSSFFTPVPLSGFVFDSAFGPGNSTFDVQYDDTATSGTIIVNSGNTLAPVPEPGSVALIGALGATAAFALRRRKRGA